MDQPRPSTISTQRDWPPDDGRFFAINPTTYACWPCRKTARPDMTFRARSNGSRRSDPMDRAWPCCPSCGAQMVDMGAKWRPGRNGKWKTGAEVDAEAQRRIIRRHSPREEGLLVKPRWTKAKKKARAVEVTP